jgi:hypothetical protein
MRKFRNVAFNFLGISHVDHAQIESDRSNGLDHSKLADATYYAHSQASARLMDG